MCQDALEFLEKAVDEGADPAEDEDAGTDPGR
jgi:hypothetical protein